MENSRQIPAKTQNVAELLEGVDYWNIYDMLF